MRLRSLLLATAVAVTAVVGFGAAPAAATDRNGVCEIYEACFWYSPNYQNSMIDFFSSNSPAGGNCDADIFGDCSHANDRFRTAGAGQNTLVIDNAASVHNRDTLNTLYVYPSKNCTGSPAFAVQPGTSHPDMNNMRNRNESHCWF